MILWFKISTQWAHCLVLYLEVFDLFTSFLFPSLPFPSFPSLALPVLSSFLPHPLAFLSFLHGLKLVWLQILYVAGVDCELLLFHVGIPGMDLLTWFMWC